MSIYNKTIVKNEYNGIIILNPDYILYIYHVSALHAIHRVYLLRIIIHRTYWERKHRATSEKTYINQISTRL